MQKIGRLTLKTECDFQKERACGSSAEPVFITKPRWQTQVSADVDREKNDALDFACSFFLFMSLDHFCVNANRASIWRFMKFTQVASTRVVGGYRTLRRRTKYYEYNYCNYCHGF